MQTVAWELKAALHPEFGFIVSKYELNWLATLIFSSLPGVSVVNGISVMVAADDWLGDETDATLDEAAETPEGCVDGDSELV